MTTPEVPTVLLFDLDNTLLDADAARAAIDGGIRGSLGDTTAERFWASYEDVREALGYVDVREAMLRLGRERGDASLLAPLAGAVYSVDYARLLYPGALDALAHARSLGLPVLVTDGDPGFQRHKARAAGVETAVEGRVLVYAHKEREIDDIRARFPAERYVVVDDKPSIHAAFKGALGPGVTTVLVEQGRYAREAGAVEPPPDLRLPSIGAFAGLTAQVLRVAS
ncbi:MAG: haloacid dehalogenase-like hydrolase [Chloroflexi bacterium]|nr:haloacid dehalogenase-like hydrolase [Chloroflexota bacterium]